MATFVWRGNGRYNSSGNWTHPNDWRQPGGPPGPDDVAVFRQHGGAEFVYGSGTVDRLVLNQDVGAFEGTLTLLGTTGTSLTILASEDADFAGPVSATTVLISTGRAPGQESGIAYFDTLTATSVVIDATAAAATSQMVYFFGPAATQHLDLTAGVGASATLLVNGASWSNAGSVVVGGPGTALIDGSGTVRIGYQGESGNLIIGDAAGGSATVDLFGGVLDVANQVRVGTAGAAALVVGAALIAHAGGLQVAAGGSVTLQGFHKLEHGASETATLSVGIGTIAAGGIVQGAGVVSSARGIDNSGTITADGHLQIDGTVTDVGIMNVDANSRLELRGAILGTGTIAFLSADNASLLIGADPTIDPTITGFAAGDEIRAVDVDSVSYDPLSGILTLETGGVAEGTLTLAGSYAAGGFQVTPSGNQGVITYTAPAAHPAIG